MGSSTPLARLELTELAHEIGIPNSGLGLGLKRRELRVSTGRGQGPQMNEHQVLPGHRPKHRRIGQRAKVQDLVEHGPGLGLFPRLEHAPQGHHVVAGDLRAVGQEGAARPQGLACEGPPMALAQAPRELEDHDLDRGPLEGRGQLVEGRAQVRGEVLGRVRPRRPLEVRGQDALGQIVVVERGPETGVEPDQAFTLDQVGKPEIAIRADATPHVRLARTRRPDDPIGRGGSVHGGRQGLRSSVSPV